MPPPGKQRVAAGQLRRLGNLGRRFLVDARYRTHVLDVVQRMTQVNATELDAVARDRDLGWVAGKRLFFIGGCEFTYLKETFDALGATTYHTFDHGRSSDPLGEVLDDDSPLWGWDPDYVLLSQVQMAGRLFHRTQWSGSDYRLEEQEADLAAIGANYGQSADHIHRRTGAPTFLLTHPLIYRPALGVHEYRSLTENLSLAEMVRRYELEVYRVAKERPDTFVVDLAHAFESQGRAKALNGDLELLGEHLTRAGAADVFDQLIVSMAAATSGTRRIKCAVFDLDDTLWSGVIREVGDKGVLVRHVYLRAIRYLAARGIVIALASKNDPVEEQYLEPLLGKDFCKVVVARKLSWDLKSDSLKQLARELNLGLDSFAFFDDNERERAEVRLNAPEVLVLSDSDILRSLNMPEFQPLGAITAEARGRAASYRAESARAAAEAAAPQSKEQFLASLELHLTLRRPETGELDRVHELLARTNQLNATLRRSSLGDLVHQFEHPDEFDVHVGLLEDRFGDYGLIGAMVAARSDTCWTITELAFSCRAMGRGVEQAFLVELAARAREAGADRVVVDFVATERNGQMRQALDAAGFRPLLDDVRASDVTRLALELADTDLNPPSWLGTRADT